MIDWQHCASVEIALGKMASQPVIRGTRVRPGDLRTNRDQGEAWLARNHGIEVETIREIFAVYD